MTKEKRNILLIEPGYKNKYPPIGLMKIATYHRILGDKVTFYKGDVKEFIFKQIANDCIKKLNEINKEINWDKKTEFIEKYIKTKQSKYLKEILAEVPDIFNDTNSKLPLLELWLKHYSDYYKKKKYEDEPEWDRVYVTTLFTFYWKITIEAIEFAKKIVKNKNELKIGGILATVLADEVYKATGIKPHKGLLNKPGYLDDNDIIVDELPLDYSILDEVDYKYPENNAYYGYMTRGCIRKCPFCAVWKIEPKFNQYISIKDKIEHAKKIYGEQRNLLLLDNNVLASKKFSEIIKEIKECGFEKNTKFVEPNYLDIAITNLKKGLNNRAYINKSFALIQFLLQKVKDKVQQDLYNQLDEYDLLKIETTTKEKLISVYPKIKDLFEKYRNKAQKQRYVDFNQGLDARLLDENKMQLLSEIPINPLRIAFDSMKYEKVYTRAIELAAKYEIRNLSNYLLYNEKDKPEELYKRLEININLCENLNINIYSFPMKFHPINGDQWYKNRDYLGTHWNRKYIRAIQTILNATKGKIGRGQSFFYKAFGKNIDEFFKILIMPETYILYRYFFQDRGYTDKWWNEFIRFKQTDKKIIKKIVHTNEFKDIPRHTGNSSIIKFINKHYLISREDIKNPNSKYYKEKKEYDAMKSKPTKSHLQVTQAKTQPEIEKELAYSMQM
jgi:hypothetical protein